MSRQQPTPSVTRQAGLVQGITLLLPSGLSIMAIVVLVPILPLLLEHFKSLPGAAYRVPMLLTIPAACLIFASPIAGWAADRFGRRQMLLAAMTIYAGVGMLPMLLDSYAAIFTSRVVLGCVEAVVLTVSTTLIGDFFKGAARDRWLGYQIGVASIFATSLIWVGGALSVYGWRGPFAVYGTAFAMMLGVAFFTWEPEKQPRSSILPLPKDELQQPNSRPQDFPWPRMIALCALTLVASILFYFVLIQLPLMLAAHGMPPSATSGFWLAVVGFGVTIGTLLFGQMARISPPRLLVIAFLILGLSFWAMSQAASIKTLLIAATINQIGAGILMPTLLTWATSGLPDYFRGRGTGLWQGTFSLGQFVMPILVTLMAESLGGLNAATLGFAAGALALAAGFAAYVGYVRLRA